MIRSRRPLISRRTLLSAAAASLALPSLSIAQEKEAPVLVFVFLRGALDGLSAVIPYQEKRYYELRESIAIARPGKGTDPAIDLDRRFALHPALAPLLPAYRSGELAVIHATGLSHGTRSHFDAQDFVELGTPESQDGPGWLARMLSTPSTGPNSVAAVALEASLPRSLYGLESAFVVENLESIRSRRRGPLPEAARAGFEQMYSKQGTTDPVQHKGSELFRLLHRLEPLLEEAPRADYPDTPFARQLADVARLVRARIGKVFTLTLTGWDTHRGQGGARGLLARRLADLADSLAAFRVDMGPELSRTVVLTVTEFGRTVRQNGTNGTDHGYGSVAFLMGGPVRGGYVHGQWPGLQEEALHQERDLAVTTDFRDVFAAIAHAHLQVAESTVLFPGFELDSRNRAALFR
jgi:uncharacterized protein (DUF1501 family)